MAQLIQEVLVEVEVHSYVAVFAVVARMEEACHDSQVFRAQSKSYYDVLSVLNLIQDHSCVVDNCMEGRKVFADVLHTREQQLEDVRKEDMAVDSKWEKIGCAHMEMQYSVRRDVAAVVLDP